MKFYLCQVELYPNGAEKSEKKIVPVVIISDLDLCSSTFTIVPNTLFFVFTFNLDWFFSNGSKLAY